MLEVVTVWAPRPEHPKFGDYLKLLELQARTVKRAGHRHRVVSDVELRRYDTLRVDLPHALMHALIAGQLAYMRQWSGAHRVVLADIDCMIVGDLDRAFTGEWDVAVTRREHPTQPIQNGVMYFDANERAREAAVALLAQTLVLCGEKWGEDQEALALALAPVPPENTIAERYRARVAFLPTELHNHSHKFGRPRVKAERFVEHFKGVPAKGFAAGYVRDLFAPPPAYGPPRT